MILISVKRAHKFLCTLLQLHQNKKQVVLLGLPGSLWNYRTTPPPHAWREEGFVVPKHELSYEDNAASPHIARFVSVVTLVE